MTMPKDEISRRIVWNSILILMSKLGFHEVESAIQCYVAHPEGINSAYKEQQLMMPWDAENILLARIEELEDLL